MQLRRGKIVAPAETRAATNARPRSVVSELQGSPLAPTPRSNPVRLLTGTLLTVGMIALLLIAGLVLAWWLLLVVLATLVPLF